ncbi:ribbon-helix-helix domain-containing protein [Rathayibacter sp. AY1C4]|uniref:ribbon-helix-helix domain-containing protein n=1 Tax=Rathayibacter sp. AY1C4 TaxID=2080537 RepID=UPI0015E48D71|nr:ribbon-helix-helix domain-containing protein [Rathayibacter sp. AY1C4]
MPPTQLAVFSVRLPQDSIRAVKILAAEQGVPVQVLAAEAFQLLLAQYEGHKADDK